MDAPFLIEDLDLILELTGTGLAQLADELGVSRMTLNRWYRNPQAISKENLECVYRYAFGRGIRLNLIHEQLFQEEASSVGAIPLYHGSKAGISGTVSLERSQPDNDFGPGFYCGDSLEQSAMFIARYPDSVLYSVAFRPSGLARQSYVVDRDWMLTIALYRGKLEAYRDDALLRRLAARVEAADYVTAPIADNRMFALIDSFIDGEITDVQCQHSLSATDLGSQYVLRTQKALDALVGLQPRYLCQPERNHYTRQRKESNALGTDKVKIAKRQYRGQGAYIDEILEGGMQ